MTYAITLDIDGTIVSHDGNLSPLTLNVVKQLQEKGHLVMLATGRPLGGALPIYKALNLTTPIITDNGSCIDHPLDQDFLKQRTYMPVEVMHRLYLRAKPYLITAFFNVEDIIYAHNYSPKLERIFSGLNANQVVEKEFDQIFDRPTGLIFIINPDNKADLENFMIENFSHILAFRLWGEDENYATYEIYLKHVSKASAILYILNYYGIPKENWISFGDGINDVEMIRDAHLGVAMKNAHPSLKLVSKDITPLTHDEDGVAHYLISYFNLTL